MLAKTPLRDLAIAWLEAQDPDETYRWGDVTACGCARFARATGRYDEWMVAVLSRSIHQTEWKQLNTRAMGRGNCDWTLGKFLERLRITG